MTLFLYLWLHCMLLLMLILIWHLVHMQAVLWILKGVSESVRTSQTRMHCGKLPVSTLITVMCYSWHQLAQSLHRNM